MSKKFLLSIAAICLSLATLTDIVVGGENVPARSKRGVKKLNIKVVPWGPTQTDVDAATQRAASSEAVRSELSGAKFRQVGFEYIYDAAESKGQASKPPTRFRVIYYNYSNDMTLFAEGDFAAKETISARWVNAVPGVGDERDQGCVQNRRTGRCLFKTETCQYDRILRSHAADNGR